MFTIYLLISSSHYTTSTRDVVKSFQPLNSGVEILEPKETSTKCKDRPRTASKRVRKSEASQLSIQQLESKDVQRLWVEVSHISRHDDTGKCRHLDRGMGICTYISPLFAMWVHFWTTYPHAAKNIQDITSL